MVVVTLIALAGTRLILLQTTDLVYAHRVSADGLPVYGSLFASLSLPVLALWVVMAYWMAARWGNKFERSVFLTALTAGVVGLIVASGTIHSASAEIAVGVGILAFVAALQFVASRRMALAQASEQQRAREQALSTATLARTDRRSRLALQSGSMGWYEYQPLTRAIERSPELDIILGLEPSETPETIDEGLDFLYPADRPRFEAYMANTEAVGTGSEEFRWVRPDGRTVWIEINALRVDGEDGHVEVVGMVKDVTERKAAEQELLFQVRHDSLTGLPDRAALTGTSGTPCYDVSDSACFSWT